MQFSLAMTVPPALEPLTLPEAREQARVDDTSEDDYLEALIPAARQYCEAQIDRQLITATYALVLDSFPDPLCPIRLPRPKLLGVTSIAYADQAGATQVIAPSDYQVDLISQPGRIMPAFSLVWPYARRQMNAVTITYTAGYGPAAADVPGPIIQAMKLLVSHWFENREPIVVGTIVSDVPLTVKALLAPYRMGMI